MTARDAWAPKLDDDRDLVNLRGVVAAGDLAAERVAAICDAFDFPVRNLGKMDLYLGQLLEPTRVNLECTARLWAIVFAASMLGSLDSLARGVGRTHGPCS